MPWSLTLANGETAARAKRIAGKSLYTLGSGLCTAGVAVAKAAATGYQTLTADRSDREKVTCARVGEIDWRDPGQGSDCRLLALPVVLLGYDTGFQVWSLEDRDAPAELSSIRRDGAVRWLEPVPQPRSEDPPDGPLHDTRPLLAVVPAPAPAGEALDGRQAPQQHRVQLFSLRTQGYVKTLAFSSEVQSVLCSSRVLVVALRGQLQVFDAVTLEHTLSCVTYCPPPSRPPQQEASQQQAQHRAQLGGQEGQQEGAALALTGVPCALGPRWLAYAADQAVQHSGSLAKAQRLPLHRRDSGGSGHASVALAISGHPAVGMDPGAASGSMGSGSSPVGALTSAAVAEAAREYAKKSGQHLAAGLAAAGSASYKYLSSQYRHWRSGAQQGALMQQGDASVAGTVLVRDVVTRQVVCHFRAHTSPLATMQFTPDGTMLATASVAGHNVNVFRIVPPAPSAAAAGLDGDAGGLGGAGAAGHPGGDVGGYAVHLFRLHRGVTPAVIQAISFAPDTSWAAVTSGRATSHVFHLAPALAARLPPAGRVAAGPMDAALQQQQRRSFAPAGSVGGAAGGLKLEDGAFQQHQQQQPLRVEEGVMGQGVKLVAVGRAGGKAGLLGSGIAGAATHAALSVYGQQSGVLPAAAAFLPVRPGSPRALAGPHHLAIETSPLALMVVSWEGQLTRHALRTADALRSVAPTAPINAHYPPGGSTRDGSAGDGRQAGALLEEARWDICRQHGWQEREEMPPCFLPMQPGQGPVDVHSNSGSVLGSPQGSGMLPPLGIVGNGSAGSVDGDRGPAPLVDPCWLSQAESAPALLDPPLWASEQFRFFALPSAPSQPRQGPQAQPGSLPWAYDGGGMCGGSSPCHTQSSSGAMLGSSPSGGVPYMLHGSPAGMANGFGAHYGRPGSSLSSTPPY